MTLTTPYQASFYVGDGETKAFPFVFEELSDNFVKVIVSHIDGTTSIPTYTVDLELKQVVFGDETPAPTVDDVVCIYRETPTIQDTPFKTLEGYNAKALENILSKIVAMIQEIKSNYFSTQVLQGDPWQLDLLKSADDGATVNIDYVAKKLVKGLYFQITDGNLQVSADGSSYITMPKSSDVAELRQQVITLPDLTVIKKLQYRVNNEWFDAESNAEATAGEALQIAQDAKDIAQDAKDIVDTVDGRVTQAEQDASDAKDIAQDAKDQVDDLQDEVDSLKGRGRFLSIWNCATGLAETNPPESPYTYQAGDYFIVGVVSSATPAVNYKPNGATYTTGVPSTTVESAEVNIDDTYIYDGTTWKLQANSQREYTFSGIAGSPYDNTALGNALNGKVDETSTANQVYGTDNNGDQTTYNITDFGAVDDVKVNNVSVVTSKIANIDLTSYLKNIATATDAISVLGTANTSWTNGINIGKDSRINSNNGVAIGVDASADVNAVGIGRDTDAGVRGTAIGAYAKTSYDTGIAIGCWNSNTNNAVSSAKGAYQFGVGTNNTARTLNIGWYDDSVSPSTFRNYLLLDGNTGLIPDARISINIARTADIPTVNDATLTIQKNGTDIDTFTANSATNKTVNITVPTTPSDIGAQAALTAGTNIQITGTTISATDTTYSNFTGATAGDAGASGLVPAPAAGDQGKFLQGDGTWANPTIPTVNDATITITQGGVTKGSFTLNQASGDTIALDAGGSGGLPSQTGNAGKFLTTDGTDASWSDKVLVRKSTNSGGIVVDPNRSTDANVTDAVLIGKNASSSIANYTVAIGGSSVASKMGTIAIGANSGATAGGAITNPSIAIGRYAKAENEGSISIGSGKDAGPYANANYAIQLGIVNNGTWTYNSDAKTFKVANGDGNFEMMSADGTIPTDRFTTTPSTDGDYIPSLSIASGVATRSWQSADYVVEFQAPTAQNNYTWYRKYKSGWVEQGGIATNTSTTDRWTYSQVSFPIEMADTNYVALGTAYGMDNVSTVLCCIGGIDSNNQDNGTGKTTTGMLLQGERLYSGGPSRITKWQWQVSGMAQG